MGFPLYSCSSRPPSSNWTICCAQRNLDTSWWFLDSCDPACVCWHMVCSHLRVFKSHKNPSTSCLALTLLEIILKSWTWYFCILKRSSITNLVGLTYNIHFLHALSHSTFEVCIRTTRKEWKGHLFQQLDTLESSIHLLCLKPFFKMWTFHPPKPSDIRGLFTHEQTVLCMPQSEPCENFQLELAWDAHA